MPRVGDLWGISLYFLFISVGFGRVRLLVVTCGYLLALRANPHDLIIIPHGLDRATRRLYRSINDARG